MSSPVSSRISTLNYYDSYDSDDNQDLDDEKMLDCSICYDTLYPVTLPLQLKETKKVKAIGIKQNGESYLYINKCHHIFHQACLLTWFRTCKTKSQPSLCPNCKEVVTKVKKVKKNGCFAAIFR